MAMFVRERESARARERERERGHQLSTHVEALPVVAVSKAKLQRCADIATLTREELPPRMKQ